MKEFRVYFDFAGKRYIPIVTANSSEEAANKIRKQYPGALIMKVKVNKSKSAQIPQT